MNGLGLFSSLHIDSSLVIIRSTAASFTVSIDRKALKAAGVFKSSMRFKIVVCRAKKSLKLVIFEF